MRRACSNDRNNQGDTPPIPLVTAEPVTHLFHGKMSSFVHRAPGDANSSASRVKANTHTHTHTQLAESHRGGTKQTARGRPTDAARDVADRLGRRPTLRYTRASASARLTRPLDKQASGDRSGRDVAATESGTEPAVVARVKRTGDNGHGGAYTPLTTGAAASRREL